MYESLGIISNELSSLKNSLLITTGARKRIFTNQLLSDTTLTFKSITVNILTDLVFLLMIYDCFVINFYKSCLLKFYRNIPTVFKKTKHNKNCIL